jgi:Xaa-Pro dipeptidase
MRRLAPARGFPTREFEARLARAQRFLAEAGAGACLLCTEPDVAYFTGLASQFWHSPTRPIYVVLAARGLPIAVVPEILKNSMAQSSWVQDVRTWPAPVPADDGVSLLGAALREALSRSAAAAAHGGARSAVVALPMSLESQLRMPVADLDRLRADLGIRLVDAMPLIHGTRGVKSPLEQEKLRYACQTTSDAFEALPSVLRASSGIITERDVASRMRRELLRAGMDNAPYVIARSGQAGYNSIVDGPTDRVLRPGDVLAVDTGAVWDGYYADFDRNFYVVDEDNEHAALPADVALAHERLWMCTEAGIQASVPGATMADVHGALKASLVAQGVGGSEIDAIMGCGRWGHGLGRQLTEGPSLVAGACDAILEPGTVMTIEPSLPLPDGRILVHEEDILITEHGAELLSRRAPQEMARVVLAAAPKAAPEAAAGEGERDGAGRVFVGGSAAGAAPEPRFDSAPPVTLGLVQLPSDMTLDMEAGPLLSQFDGKVAWRMQKMQLDSSKISSDTYERSVDNIRDAASTFLPQNTPGGHGHLDVVAMCCTSLSFVLGSDAVQQELSAGYPGARVHTDMAEAVMAALHAVMPSAARRRPRVCLLTPYIDEVHAKNVAFLERGGIDVVAQRNLGLETDAETTSVAPAFLAEAAIALAHSVSGADAVFIGCSAFRSTGFGFIDDVESRLPGGMALITSNQALLWHCLQMSSAGVDGEEEGLEVHAEGYGRLFRPSVACGM